MKETIQGLIIFFLFLHAYDVASQDLNDKIVFTGIQKTKSSYLLSKINQVQNSQDLVSLQNIQALKNLPGISDVTFEKRDDQYIYNITERRTALPILGLGGVKDNFWFSIGWSDYNFRGQGEDLLVYYQNTDGRHSGKLYYRNPTINQSKWGYDLSINKWSSIEPVFFEEGTINYLFDNNGFGLSLIRNFSSKINLAFGGIFFKEIYQKEETDLGINVGPDELSLYKYLTAIEFNRNYLDYNFYSITGYHLQSRYQNVYNFKDESWFNSIQLTAKYFLLPFPKTNIASRLRLALSTNNFSPFAPFVLDSRVNIRGVGNRIDRGTAQVVLNIEIRQSIFEKGSWASQAVVFSDAGTWRNPGGQLGDIFNRNQFRHFVGAGLRIVYQHVFGATLRIDYGVDVYNTNERGFVIGLGQYF